MEESLILYRNDVADVEFQYQIQQAEQTKADLDDLSNMTQLIYRQLAKEVRAFLEVAGMTIHALGVIYASSKGLKICQVKSCSRIILGGGIENSWIKGVYCSDKCLYLHNSGHLNYIPDPIAF